MAHLLVCIVLRNLSQNLNSPKQFKPVSTREIEKGETPCQLLFHSFHIHSLTFTTLNDDDLLLPTSQIPPLKDPKMKHLQIH